MIKAKSNRGGAKTPLQVKTWRRGQMKWRVAGLQANLSTILNTGMMGDSLSTKEYKDLVWCNQLLQLILKNWKNTSSEL